MYILQLSVNMRSHYTIYYERYALVPHLKCTTHIVYSAHVQV